MNLGQFLGLPMMAGPRDIPMGEDELGNVLYAAGGAPSGQRYTKKTAPPNRSSVVKALVNGAKAKPWETVGNLVKGAAEGALQGISAPGRAAAGEPLTYGDVAATAMDWGLVNAPGLAFGKYDPATVNMGIRAYHGSPHDFDRFDMSKIGTGEGAQAYGHGLYFAEAEDVARQYRDDLSSIGFSVDGERYTSGLDASEAFSAAFPDMPIDVQNAVRYYLNRGFTVDDAMKDLRANYPEWADKVSGRLADAPTDGRLYEVSINADPADFLDWDAPLSEQPQRVRDAFSSIAPETSKTPRGDMGYMLNEASNEVASRDGSWSTAASKANITPALRDAGIPGIKYYDQGSRASGQGTRNYVVFDDALIEILRKYGLAGAAPLGAILGTQDDEKQRIRDFLNQ